MSEEVKRRAFEPLFTTKQKTVHKGQGLGLAMVYNIITRNHEGYISIDSEEGKGTEMNIYIPKAESCKKVKSKAKLKTEGGGCETLLLIEDEFLISSIAHDILSDFGYSVLVAGDGKEGLEVFKKHRDSIDLILLDLTMPEMSGGMLFEKMIKIDPMIKVIITSGHSDDKLRKGILSMAKAYVKKPYKMKYLVQVVRTVLDS